MKEMERQKLAGNRMKEKVVRMKEQTEVEAERMLKK